jgi:SAM-dependent methyltransferase
MNYKLKTFARAITPPIILSGAATVFDSARSVAGKPGERNPAWYDRNFAFSKGLHAHYTESQYYHLWAIIAHLIARAGVCSVLDIGCGPGQLAFLLKNRGLTSYCGIDFSPKRIEWAKSQCPGFIFVVADALKTDLLETFNYDTVVCTEFLEHVDRDTEVIARIRPGARFYATLPNFPFISHVRFFKSATEVYDRYATYFREFRVDSFAFTTKGKSHFLLEGTKR